MFPAENLCLSLFALDSDITLRFNSRPESFSMSSKSSTQELGSISVAFVELLEEKSMMYPNRIQHHESGISNGI